MPRFVPRGLRGKNRGPAAAGEAGDPMWQADDDADLTWDPAQPTVPEPGVEAPRESGSEPDAERHGSREDASEAWPDDAATSLDGAATSTDDAAGSTDVERQPPPRRPRPGPGGRSRARPAAGAREVTSSPGTAAEDPEVADAAPDASPEASTGTTARSTRTRPQVRPPGRPGARAGAQTARPGRATADRDRGKVKPGRKRRRGGWSGWLTTIFLAAALLVSLQLTGVAWLGARHNDRTDDARRDAVSAATAAAQAIFSYDYRTFDQSVSNGRTYATGSFSKEYAQTTHDLKATAVKEQAVVRATVPAASVLEAGPDQVVVLLYVNQFRRNVNITGEKVDQNRVLLTMNRSGADWKVSKALAV